MRPELKRLHSPDIYDLVNYQPDDPGVFGFLLQVMVGIEGVDGEESFDVEICTPRWLEKKYGVDDIVLGKHHLIVRAYSYSKIEFFIRSFLKGCEGDSRENVAEKVSSLGKWEFEGYEG